MNGMQERGDDNSAGDSGEYVDSESESASKASVTGDGKDANKQGKKYVLRVRTNVELRRFTRDLGMKVLDK